MRRRVVFVVGPPHCGSTLLGLMLGTHERAACVGELSRLPVAAADGNVASRCGACEDGCPVWDTQEAEALLRGWYDEDRYGGVRVVLRGLVRSYYAPLFRLTGAEVLVDTSKTPQWLKTRMRNLPDRLGATPLLLLMTRDGRGVVNSWRRKAPETPFAAHIARWRGVAEDLEATFDGFPPDRRHRVRYEDLATSPAPVLAAVQRFAGLPVRESLPAFWTGEHHPISGNIGTRSMLRRYAAERAGHAFETDLGRGRDGYYRDLGLSVRLDERWREELSPGELAAFETEAGPLNARYAAG